MYRNCLKSEQVDMNKILVQPTELQTVSTQIKLLLRNSLRAVWSVYNVCTEVPVKAKYCEVFIVNLPSSCRKWNKSKCIHFRNILRQEPVWLVFHMVWTPDCWVVMNIINVDGYVCPSGNMVALYFDVLSDLSLHKEYWAMAT